MKPAHLFPTLGVPHCVPVPEVARLRSTYLARRYERAPYVVPACVALLWARERVASGAYDFAPRFTQGFQPIAANGARWVEDPESAGLRHVADTDSGWYLDSDCSEVCHGTVWRLPVRRGVSLFLAGYRDPWNDGPVCLWPEVHTDESEALRSAAHHAARTAEAEREYNDAWRAGQEARELAAEATRAASAWAAAERARREGHATGVAQQVAVELRHHAARLCDRFHDARERAAEARQDAPSWEPERGAWRDGYGV